MDGLDGRRCPLRRERLARGEISYQTDYAGTYEYGGSHRNDDMNAFLWEEPAVEETDGHFGYPDGSEIPGGDGYKILEENHHCFRVFFLKVSDMVPNRTLPHAAYKGNFSEGIGVLMSTCT